MLRVLTLSTLYPSDAQPLLGKFVATQTERLAARDDVELQVVSPLALPPPPFDRHPRYASLRALPLVEQRGGVTVHRPRATVIPVLGAALNPWFVARAARPVLARLRRDGFAFDVIDAEFFHPDGAAAMRLGRDFGVPFSIKARGSDIEYWARRPDTRAAIRRAAAAAGGLLCVSADLSAMMTSLGLPPAAVHYTGVDLTRFAERDRAGAKAAFGIDGPLVASAGNLIALKGHALLIAAVVTLPGVSLLIAGEGSERPALAAAIAASGAGDRIRLLGAIPPERLAQLFTAADVTALASEREGLSNAWVESLAAGAPVVAPDIGSAREVIDRPAAGRIAERTPAAFAAAIAELLANPPGRDATRAAADRFTWERNTDALFDHLSAIARRAKES